MSQTYLTKKNRNNIYSFVSRIVYEKSGINIQDAYLALTGRIMQSTIKNNPAPYGMDIHKYVIQLNKITVNNVANHILSKLQQEQIQNKRVKKRKKKS